MGITYSNKTTSVASINCTDEFNVTLALTAAPDITTNPTDIVLILDRSGSMEGSPLASMKAGAKTFIDIIAEATDTPPYDEIGSGSRIGIVSFADTATQDTQLITSVDDLKDAVDALDAGGDTNHYDAFLKASQLFDPMSTNAKVIVMFTDGKTTAGLDPTPLTAQIKQDGVIIYCIGLVGSDGIDPAVLNTWASQPSSAHVAITPDDTELEELFAQLAANITKTGATCIKIIENLNPDFNIVSIEPPTIGTARIRSLTKIVWKIDELGVSATEGASLTFTVRHVAADGGLKYVNDSVEYTDCEGNLVEFPDPQVLVSCGGIVVEDCPEPMQMLSSGCGDVIEFDAGEIALQSIGRIAMINLTLRNVCPDRRVALAVFLTERNALDEEFSRGVKTFLIPAHSAAVCSDININCIKFILPEELDVSGADPTLLCNERRFHLRVFAHYVDTDFLCCNNILLS